MFHVKHFRLRGENAAALDCGGHLGAATGGRLNSRIEVVSKDSVFRDSFRQQQGCD